jgi:hypothetical protein
VVACGGPPLPDFNVGRLDRAITEDNGESINGISFNGTSLNGTSLNGTSLNGTSLNGTSLNGTSLTGTLPDNTTVTGDALAGLVLGSLLADGTPLSVRIDKVIPVDGDTTQYHVSYLSGGQWYPICGLETDGTPAPAVPVNGTFDGIGKRRVMDGVRFTWSCSRATVGKCVAMGYKPSRSKDVGGQAVALDPYLDACVRMVRADYCGTGESWTVNGRTIDLYDGIGVQNPSSTWTFESEWTSDGARCVNQQRVVWGTRGTPSCIADKNAAVPDCGNTAHFDAGALLMNRFQTQLVQP